MLRVRNVLGLVALIGCSGTVERVHEDSDDVMDGHDDAGDVSGHADAGPGPHPDASDEVERDGAVPAEPDAETPVDTCPQGTNGTIDVVSVSVSGPQGAPRKGDELTVTLTLNNAGVEGVSAGLTVLLDSLRFDDFRAVPLATGEVLACPGETTVTLRGGPFLSDASNRQFALGSGDYHIAGVVLAQGQSSSEDRDFAGADFNMATSNVLLVPVLYNHGYFEQIEGDFASPEAYLTDAFTRPNEVFTPTTGDPDGPGDYQGFPGGFDEMMGVRHVFKSFPGFDGKFDSGENWCYGAMDYASQVLGLKARWTGRGTRSDQHGFDYVIALSSNMGGGVAWSPYDVQVSGFINRDVDRQQVIAVHESGHVFDSPHCDNVGNGSGGSLQGYVMCSGEKHEHYPTQFVWHIESRKTMSSRWN
jgi:hypothetical protein